MSTNKEYLHLVPDIPNVPPDFRWLHLNRWIPQRDVRLLIYRFFNTMDWWMIISAHFPECKYPMFINPLYYCAYFGDIRLFEYLWQQGYRVNDGETVMIGAIRGQQLHMCEHIYSKYACRFPPLKPIIDTGNIELVKWALEKGVIVTSRHHQRAKEKGFTEIVKLLNW